MTITTVSRLKASLSEMLRKVKAGEELYITERGKTIARIVPVLRDAAQSNSRLFELERAGILRMGTGKITKKFWDLPRPKINASAVDALIKDREEGR
jgi:prevent-host-death family protein